MSWRAPRYSHVHAAREVGVSAITLTVGTAHADFPIDNLIDDRAQTIFKFTGSVSTPTIIVDLGAGFDTGINRIIIPAGHNATTIRVGQDTAVDIPSISWLCINTDISGGAVASIDLTPSTERFLQLVFSATGQFHLPQLIYTKIVELDAGPNFEDSPDFYKDNFTRLEQSTGQSPTIQHGPQQRVIEYPYESPLSGTDLAKMEALIADVGMLLPFWVDPHSFAADPDADDPPIWMKFAEMPPSRNSILVPRSGTESKVYPVSLIESLD